MSTMYEILDDIKAIEDAVDSLADDEGNKREPTDEEKAVILQWIGETESAFKQKFDSICRFVKNLKIEAEIAEAERKAHKDELDRLARTARAKEHKADAVRWILQAAMDRLGIKKYKSPLFSAGIQATAKVPKMASGFSVPPEFAKPAELDTAKVREALKSGMLTEREGKLYRGGQDTGIAYLGGETCVIR